MNGLTINRLTVCLELIFHVIFSFFCNFINGIQSLPNLSSVRMDNVAKIEAILDDRKVGRIKSYLVRWKKSDKTFNSWEPGICFLLFIHELDIYRRSCCKSY